MAKKLQASDEFKELIRRQSITITLSSNVNLSITETYAPVKVQLNTIKSVKNSSLYTFTSNGIKINKSGFYLISGNAMVNSTDTNQTVLARIYKQGSSNMRLSEGYCKINGSGWQTISLTPMLYYLEANDMVYLGVGGSSTGTVGVGGGSCFSYLTITEL